MNSGRWSVNCDELTVLAAMSPWTNLRSFGNWSNVLSFDLNFLAWRELEPTGRPTGKECLLLQHCFDDEVRMCTMSRSLPPVHHFYGFRAYSYVAMFPWKCARIVRPSGGIRTKLLEFKKSEHLQAGAQAPAFFETRLYCSLTPPRRAMLECTNKLQIFFFCFFLLSRLSEPGRLGTELSGPASRLASAMTFSGSIPQLWYLADGGLLFIFNPSNAESRGGRMNLEGLASVRLDELTVVRRHWLFFLLFKCLRRGRGLGERWDKILRWRHSKIHCTHYDAEGRQECPQRHSKCEQEDWAHERQFQTQSAPYRTD